MKANQFNTDQVNLLPEGPGVYRFFNRQNQLIYVGKAKNIKKRVSSYFTKYHANRKTSKLVSEIKFIEYTLSQSEFDALLLENNLIKENQPKYNILLRDDKTFPHICILRERFPRIISTRKYNPEMGEYFGPYTSVVAMNNVLDLIRQLYTIRTCSLNLSQENIDAGKFKICLEYHIGNCLGPCENLQTEEDYNEEISQAKHILKGNLTPVRQYFRNHMLNASEQLNFEVAQKYKEKLTLLDKFQVRTTIVNANLSDIDVFSIVSDEQWAFINYLRIKNGAIIFSKTVEVKKKLEEPDEDILSFVAFELRNKYNSEYAEILSNVPLTGLPEGISVQLPKIGDKKKLITLSLKNAIQYKNEKLSSLENTRPKNYETLVKLKNDLKLTHLPKHIECFDNSNLQGSHPVASMVCFRNGSPAKKEYRHFNIKSVEGPNDFASMEEIVFRRYKRLVDEQLALPDLVVIDGGKGQLTSAVKALQRLGVYGKIPLIGIAKRLEEIYFPDDQYPLHISKKSPSLLLLQRIRDEAHRFAITFHRKKRSKSEFKTELESIPGVGKETANKLLKKFKSVKKIKDADPEALSQIVGNSKAAVITAYFKK